MGGARIRLVFRSIMTRIPLFYIVISLLTYALAAEEKMEVPVIVSQWWQIADEDFDAGAFNNKPARGEPTLDSHQECSDFTIYQSADGKWQLVSAVRNTNFPGGDHFLFRWETNDLLASDWEEKGILWTTHDSPEEAGYVEGVLYAPHTVRHDGTFYMFHNSGGTAHAFTSEDGVNYEQARGHDGSYVLFDAGEAGRDLMVMDNRERDGLWYVYYTRVDWNRPELKDRQYSDVYARTAKELLGPWSEEVAVGMGTPERPRDIVHARYDFVNTESQFVIYHKGYYYKFEQTFVTASKDPLDFEDKPVIANLTPAFQYPEMWWPALAPEIIEHDGKLYIAYFMNHNGHPLKSLTMGGVFLAELGWE